MRRFVRSVVLVALSLVSCSAPQTPKAAELVDRELLARTGRATTSGADALLPPGLELGDGLSTDEAIAVALWNDPEFLAALAELGLARADVTQAGRVRNPSIGFLFAVGDKQAEATLTAPLESWLSRGARMRAADRAFHSTCARIVGDGVRLAAAVQAEMAELDGARRAAGAQHARAERARRVAEIEEARERIGDGTRDESLAARDRAFAAEHADAGARLAVERAELRLRARFGAAAALLPLDDLRCADPMTPGVLAEDHLLLFAATTRPDARAARYEVEAARERADAVRLGRIPVSVIGDANSDGESGWETGPGLALELPLFDDGSARVARAEAEVARAERRRDAVDATARGEIERTLAELHVAFERAVRERGERLPAAASRLLAAQMALQSGVLSELEVARVELAFREAELSALDAELGWHLATAAFMGALGCDPRKLAGDAPRSDRQ